MIDLPLGQNLFVVDGAFCRRRSAWTRWPRSRPPPTGSPRGMAAKLTWRL